MKQTTYKRAMNTIEFAAWAQHHLLKPVDPPDDSLCALMPWREDVDSFDLESRPFFLVSPADFDDLNEEAEAMAVNGQPLIVEKHAAMRCSALDVAARYYFFELATNPRALSDADKLLKVLAAELAGPRNLAGSSRAFSRGRYVHGPLGMIEIATDERRWFDVPGSIEGSLADYGEAVARYEHTAASLRKNSHFDFKCIGWPAARFGWLVREGILEVDQRAESKFVGMLAFRKLWSPDKSASRDELLTRIEIDGKATGRLVEDLEKCVQRFGDSCFEDRNWTLAPRAKEIVQTKNFSELDRGSVQQLLLALPPEMLCANHKQNSKPIV